MKDRRRRIIKFPHKINMSPLSRLCFTKDKKRKKEMKKKSKVLKHYLFYKNFIKNKTKKFFK